MGMNMVSKGVNAVLEALSAEGLFPDMEVLGLSGNLCCDKKPAAVNWTTLGTRATPAQPGTSITSNAGAKWVDYNPPVLYAGVARQATQYISMPDGTKLAAYVTLPADASGNAATGSFPTVLVQTSYNGGNAQYEASIGAALGAAGTA